MTQHKAQGMNTGVGYKRVGRQVLLGCLMASAINLAAAAAVPPERVVQVEAGTHKLLRENAAIKRVAVGDPNIADVNVINGREVLITGKKLGVTSLMVWNGATPTEYRIKVGAVHDPLQAGITDVELADAKIDKGVGLSGRLPNLNAHRRATLAAANGKDPVADTSEVDLDMQVMTQIKIAEVNRTLAQRYGFNILKNNGNTTAGLAPPSTLASITTNDAGGFTVASSSGFVPLQDAFNLVYGNASRAILGVLSVLEGRGMARVLAEPSLTAMSGQTASFLAGGEFPIPVAQGGSTGGSITVTYKEFGVRLNLTPTVLSRDRIALKVAPEVSDLDFSAGIQIGGVSVPALNVRRTDTTVELGDGESFVLSGLVSSNTIKNVDKVPWLGDIPIIGALFKSSSVDKQERELIMIVTPHLVRPIARGAALPPLPGAAYDKTKESYATTVFKETGKFDPADYGYGR